MKYLSVLLGPPVITSDNRDRTSQYGKFGENTEVYVNVYSIPKYSSISWYIGNTQLVSNKYVTKDEPAIVKDMFHGVEVQLVGYRAPPDYVIYRRRIYKLFLYVFIIVVSIGFEVILDLSKDAFVSDIQQKQTSKTYESLGTKNAVDVYDDLDNRKGLPSSKPSVDHYEAFSAKDKPNIYEELENKQVDSLEESTGRSTYFLRFNNKKRVRHLNENSETDVNILTDKDFQHSRDVLSAKKKDLKSKGFGNRKRKADAFTQEEIDHLYDRNLLGTSNPDALTNTVWLNNSMHFCMRSHKNIKT
ncbi:unnamed protein product [Mytilus edulis]|uniref:Uncharacterized protein n=1 Tax=Mytilus edulis TaxID=6550 RepID=A0A8S3QQJ5_MYTED|nr:unnamed protein product [Mytilus edulis]